MCKLKMFRSILLCLCLSAFTFGFPSFYLTKNFKVGVEYDHSLPMNGGSDRYRHRNNYDPFFVTVTATAKTGYVISYLEVSATVDASGEVDFNLIRGHTGSRSMVFQLVSNHSDFMAYSYLAYGIREEEYKKVTPLYSLFKIDRKCSNTTNAKQRNRMRRHQRCDSASYY